MRARVLSEKARLGNRVVADEDDESSTREQDAVVSGAAGAGIRLRSKCDAVALGQNRVRLVGRSVVDHDRLEVRRVNLLLERIEHALQHRDPIVSGDDDRERWPLTVGRWPGCSLGFGQRHADTPPSMHRT